VAVDRAIRLLQGIANPILRFPMHILNLVSIGLVVACASTPSPTIDFGSVTIPEVTATQPIALPERPELVECIPGFACMSDTELDLYEAHLIISEGNTGIALANAEAVDQLNIATQELVKAGKQLGLLHELQINQVVWRLEEKQRDLWAAYGMILVLGLALAF